MYQVGRNSVSQPKNAVALKPGVQTTLEPAASAARIPEIKPCPWKRGSTLSRRSRDPSSRLIPTLRADRQTLAWVKGTVFGRDVLPEVKRMNASSAHDANLGRLPRHLTNNIECAGPVVGPRHFDDRYAHGVGGASAG